MSGLLKNMRKIGVGGHDRKGAALPRNPRKSAGEGPIFQN
jgi:hypothetical protein